MIIGMRSVLNLLLPPSGPLVLVLAGFILRRRNKRTGASFIFSGFFLLYLFSTGLISNLLVIPLERDFPPLKEFPARIDAIVVLTCGMKEPYHEDAGTMPDERSLESIVLGVSLHRRHPKAQLIISGGKADPSKPDLSIAEALGATARKLGIADDKLVLEEESKNTNESALEIRKRFPVRRILLVTSASHMGRSIRLFRNAGFEAIPAPSGYRANKSTCGYHSLIPTAGGLQISSDALYEYVARLWYAVMSIFASAQ